MTEITEAVVNELVEKVPSFIDSIAMVVEGQGHFIMMSVDAFGEQPDLFYKAMSFAHSQNVEVRLVPKSFLKENKVYN